MAPPPMPAGHSQKFNIGLQVEIHFQHILEKDFCQVILKKRSKQMHESKFKFIFFDYISKLC